MKFKVTPDTVFMDQDGNPLDVRSLEKGVTILRSVVEPKMNDDGVIVHILVRAMVQVSKNLVSVETDAQQAY
jgi:hypothetical protein